MNLRTVVLLAVALAVAGLTALLVNGWLAGQKGAVEAKAPAAPAVAAPPPPEILVAKKAMPAGTFVKPDELEWRAWPREGLTEAYLVKGKASEKDLAGAVVRSHLYAGEPITTSRVVHPGEQGFLAAVLDPGKRAVAIPVDGTSGVSGFVFPGDFVDVILTIKRTVTAEGSEGSEMRQFSETLLTDVRVLAIDQTLDNDSGAAKVAKTATLEVSPKQAERVALGLDMGTLSLSLRSLGRQEADLTATAQQRSGTRSDAGEGGAQRSYARDTDVLFMIGDPLGLPPPLALRRKVSVMRGSESKEVRY
jgi:pilus assembly protein CpaB